MEYKCLYHASNNKDIEILEPRANSVRDLEEGPVVFASHDMSYATCFIVPVDDSWCQILCYSSSEHPTIHVICISDEQRFKELDQGGAIYHLPLDKFTLDRGKGIREWTSNESVKPFKKKIFDSGLDAMICNGVVVYFCETEVLIKLREDLADVNRAMSILKELLSENEKRGLENPIHKYY